MINRRETLAAFGALAFSSPIRAQEKASANADQWQKLDALLEFVRKRNAEDYAVSSSDGIDEAK